jgi:hypothetical protein
MIDPFLKIVPHISELRVVQSCMGPLGPIGLPTGLGPSEGVVPKISSQKYHKRPPIIEEKKIVTMTRIMIVVV